MAAPVYTPTLLPGEVEQTVSDQVTYENPCLHNPGAAPIGLLLVTNYRILFLSQLTVVQHQMKGQEPDYKDSEKNCDIPITCIDKVKLKKGEIFVDCKDFRSVKFSFSGRAANDVNSAFQGIDTFMKLKQQDRFCFSNKELDAVRGNHNLTSDVYDIEKELDRLEKKFPEVKKYWRVSKANSTFDVCTTYPRYFAVPAELTDEEIKKAAEHRSRGRLPILSYVHRNGASITRCAQPKAGLRQGKSKADVRMGRALLKASPYSQGFYIMDARPKLNAAANRAAGAGYEKTSHYENATLKFLDIENIHVMRDAVNKLRDLCLSTSNISQYLTAVDNTLCLTHLKFILDGAMDIVRIVEAGGAVLVHCSDGWDRTAQLCGLACLILDPYFRTFEGFMALIEKEWLQAGHKFNDRIGQDNSASSSERSPVFLQFMDCVYQIMQQFPTSFEFNESMILEMMDALYSCRFGTFLFNCEQEREEFQVKQRTPSLWEYLQYNKAVFLNPCYEAPSSGTLVNSSVPPVLPVSTHMKNIRLWHNYYMQHATKGRVEITVMLQEEIRRLRNLLRDLGHENELEANPMIGSVNLLNSSIIVPQEEDSPSTGSGWASVSRPSHKKTQSGILLDRSAAPPAPPSPLAPAARASPRPPPSASRSGGPPPPLPPVSRGSTGPPLPGRDDDGGMPPPMPAPLPPRSPREVRPPPPPLRSSLQLDEVQYEEESYDQQDDDGGPPPDSDAPPPPMGESTVVLHAWTARDTNEISVNPGDAVTVISKSNENWWFVAMDCDPNIRGHVPASYLQQ